MTRRDAALRALSARFAIALVGAFLLLALVAAGAARAECFAPEWQAEAYRDAVLAAAEGARYGELTDEERRRFLAAYNDAKPRTAVMCQRIGFFEHPKAATVMVVFIEDGCVWATGILPRALFFAMAQRGGV